MFEILQDNCQVIDCSFTCAISGTRTNSSYCNIFGFVYGADRNLIINNLKIRNHGRYQKICRRVS